MKNYAEAVSPRKTPQSEPVMGKPMVPNSAGGYAFAVDKWQRLDRFLILGAEGGTYYIGERPLIQENAKAVIECADEDAARTVNRVVEVSERGLAPKNDPAIFALALLAAHPKAKGLALERVSRVCRIGTHLFQFCEQVKHFRGRGRALNRAICEWYESKEPRALAYQLVKYQQRNGWSHKDLLKLYRPKSNRVRKIVGQTAKGKPLFQSTEENMTVYDEIMSWAIYGWPSVGGEPHPNAALLPIWAFERAKRAVTKQEVVNLIEDYDLVRECIPTQFLNEPDVWEALLHKMPITAMIRNLGKMSEVGLLKPLSSAATKVCAKLRDIEALKKGRVHPLNLLVAQKVYAQGRGMKGSLTWNMVPQVVDALDDAFYLAFEAVEPTNKRWYLGIDVSGSMTYGQVGGTPVTPNQAAAAMAMVAMRTEPAAYPMAFDNGIRQLDISSKSRLDDVIRKTANINGGGTDCSLPMRHAEKLQIPVDVFVVYTDSETWAGSIHPYQALLQYRQSMGIAAKLIVCGMVSNGFTIADPSDAGMLDVVGFSTDVPAVMSQFAVS